MTLNSGTYIICGKNIRSEGHYILVVLHYVKFIWQHFNYVEVVVMFKMCEE